ncbi:hypothetical protein JW711_05150 [Candidatus Woesearchaeota archaeon]|nr:hypothetical protein [Candidatus Woesearchaeota archaeon]
MGVYECLRNHRTLWKIGLITFFTGAMMVMCAPAAHSSKGRSGYRSYSLDSLDRIRSLPAYEMSHSPLEIADYVAARKLEMRQNSIDEAVKRMEGLNYWKQSFSPEKPLCYDRGGFGFSYPCPIKGREAPSQSFEILRIGW